MADAAELPWDKIIGAAAASTLGVLSLSVILVGLLAYSFFGRSDDRIKLWVFGAVLLATVGLAVSVLRASNREAGPTPGPSPGPSAAPTGAPSVAATGAAPFTSPTPSASPLPDASPGPSPSPSPSPTPTPSPVTANGSADVSGTWQDVEGYVYRLTQDGTRISFIQTMNGQRTGSGGGTIMGHAMTYSYLNEQTNDNGMCRAVLAANGATIDGVCGNGGNSWGFRIVRAE